MNGAANGSRTRNHGCGRTVLCQLSYSRKEKRTAMNKPRNRQKRQGGTGTRALRNGATRVHGGEHGGHSLRGRIDLPQPIH